MIWGYRVYIISLYVLNIWHSIIILKRSMTKEFRVPEDPVAEGSDLDWRVKATLLFEEKVQFPWQKVGEGAGIHI